MSDDNAVEQEIQAKGLTAPRVTPYPRCGR